MEFITLYSLLYSSIFLAASLLARTLFSSRTHRQPPGPWGWPIVGNMFDLGTIPHQTLYELGFKYGPVFWLRLGSVNTLVVQSAKAAAELFKNHDQAFSDRVCPVVLTSHNYNHGTLAFAHYGAHWRELRRVCAMELLDSKRVRESAPLWRKCVDDMVRDIGEESAAAIARGESGEMDLHPFLYRMVFNNMSSMTMSRNFRDSHSNEQGREFYDAMRGVLEGMGTPNVADFLPWLQWMDPQGLKKKMIQDMGKAMRIIGGFVKERIEEQKKLDKNDLKVKKDFLNALLEYESNEKEGSLKMSEHNIAIIITEMFFGGTASSSSTLEWAMTELLRKPETLRKAKEELDQVIGLHRTVHESDMDQLPYLQAVLKEVLRLHPALPLLIPRNTLEDTQFMRYSIPKNTQVFVNAWAIGRDSNYWDDPLSFKPERFLESNIDYKGQNYELIPFGSGRRYCIGMLLAHKMLQLALASLLHYFDWELGSSLTPKTIDMSESTGISAKKRIPLKVLIKKRIAALENE